MPAQDLANGGNSITAPAANFAAITPNDGSDLAYVTRGIYVGTGGDISAVNAAGDVVPFKSLPAGILLPIRVARIRATGTTASNIVALW